MHTHLYRRLLPQFAACVLALVMVYQLGACPCGCLEHNVWLQLAGLTDHDDPSVAPSVDLVAEAITGDRDHDCTGANTPRFVDNARPLLVEGNARSSLPIDLCFIKACGSEATDRPKRLRDRLATALNLSPPGRHALQVYRL